jgi:hypothetical protein
MPRSCTARAGRRARKGRSFDHPVPTRSPVSRPQVHRWVIEDGRAVEARSAIDTEAMLAALGPARDWG